MTTAKRFTFIGCIVKHPPRPPVTCAKCGETGIVSRGFKCWCRRQFDAQKKILRLTKKNNRGCWIWQAGLTAKGYANFSLKTPFGTFLRHRGSYVAFGHKLSLDMCLDHECRNRACMNPAHLRQMTAVENTMIGEGPTARNARKTHCKRGHPLIEGNTYGKSGHRHCRTCSLLREGVRFNPFVNGEFRIYKRQRQVGSNHPGAVLTEAQVKLIRKKYRKGVYGAQRLANEFRTTKGNVLFILARKTWTHI